MTDPRAFWSPALAHWFGVQPWMVADFTPDEVGRMHRFVNDSTREKR